jgi:hypothetical protein
MKKQTIEVKNLIKEADEWILEKRDAIELCVLLISKFEITPQDYIDKLKELKSTIGV